jgi:hypothetical protein
LSLFEFVAPDSTEVLSAHPRYTEHMAAALATEHIRSKRAARIWVPMCTNGFGWHSDSHLLGLLDVSLFP